MERINRFNVCNWEKGVRVIISFVFLLSSVLKALNINSFALEIRLYIDAYFGELKSVVPDLWGALRIDTIGAIGMCAIEMIMALLALKRVYKRMADVGFFLMLSFFVYLTGVNRFFPTIMGSIESCGCFGELIHFSPLTSFVKSAVLWIVSLVLLFFTFNCNMPWNIRKLFKDKYMYICIVTSLILPLYSLWFFETLSHWVYVAVYVVLVLFIFCVILLQVNKLEKTED